MKPIRLKDAAEKYKIPIKTLYSWSSKKKFPTMIFKLGGLVMFDEDEYERLCIEQAGQAQPKPQPKTQPKAHKMNLSPTSAFLESVRRKKEEKARGDKES